MLTTVAKLAGSSSRNDDDVIDRLHNRYTVLFLVIFAVVVSTNQYVGTPINCWAPAYFTDNHQRYTDRVRSRRQIDMHLLSMQQQRGDMRIIIGVGKLTVNHAIDR